MPDDGEICAVACFTKTGNTPAQRTIQFITVRHELAAIDQIRAGTLERVYCFSFGGR